MKRKEMEDKDRSNFEKIFIMAIDGEINMMKSGKKHKERRKNKHGGSSKTKVENCHSLK